MGIFHSYVKLPEGILNQYELDMKQFMKQDVGLDDWFILVSNIFQPTLLRTASSLTSKLRTVVF